MELLGSGLGKVFQLSYALAGSNYLAALVLFTLFTKLMLLPLGIWTQRNGVKMVKMQPQLNEIKLNYYGDKDAIAQETMALYKKEKYSALAGTVPLAAQIVVLLGILEAVKKPQLAGLSYEAMELGGISFARIPCEAGGIFWVLPVLAGLSALLLGLAQNRMNPLQAEQANAGKYGTMAVSVGVSLILGAYVPIAVGAYWIASNVLSVFQQALLNKLIDPKRYIDYQRLADSRERLASLEKLGLAQNKEKRREYAKKEKRDYKRFFSVVNKHLVFYSEKNGYYKYFESVIAYILANSSLTIHYVTSDPNDQVFQMEKENSRIRGYYIGEKKLITLFMKMDADMVVMTMPDLECFHYKRSYVRKDIEYVYMFHSVNSTHMSLRQGALDHYDTLLCVGDFVVPEIRRQEEMHSLPPKKLVLCGYGLIERLKESYDAMEKDSSMAKKLLIAPSWQEGNLLDTCLPSLLDGLLGRGWEITVRPHPEYMKRYQARMDAMIQRYQAYEGGDLFFETDFTSNASIFQAGILMTDWSGIAFEYAFVTGKPVVFIDTPPKIYNPEYEKIGIPAVEVVLRDQVGIRLDPKDLSGINEKLLELFKRQDDYKENSQRLREKYIANFGHSGEAGGSYMIQSIKEKIRTKKKA